MKNNNILRIVLVTAALLLVPLVAQWPWTLSDFVIMGALLLVTGFGIDLAMRKVEKKHRLIVAGVVIGTFLLVWGELAVGIFGTPFAGS